MKYLTILAALLILTISLTACSGATPTTTTWHSVPAYEPMEVVEVIGPVPPFNPGGPVVKITLKNNGQEPIVQLKATLQLEKPYDFVFDVIAAAPVNAGQTVSWQQTLIGPGSTIDSNASYNLVLTGASQSGTAFNYTVTVKIGTPPPAN